MLIHPPLQLFLNGHPQLSDVPVGLPSDGGKPCGAVFLDEQVVQHLLLFITEGEKELGEEAVRCQLVQLVGTGEDDVEKITLTELTEPRRIHPEGSNLRIRYSLKLQRHVSTQIFVITLPALPISVKLVPLVHHSQKVGFRPGCFLQPPQSLCTNFAFKSLLAGGCGFFLLVLQLGMIVSGVLVLLQLALQLQRAFLCKRFFQRFVRRCTVRRILPIGKAKEKQKKETR